jgi:hypothetical protein
VVDRRENDRVVHEVYRPFCDLRSCPKFDVEKYLHQLQQALPHVPPISGWELKSLHEARDYEGMVRLVRKIMNVEVKLKIGWVNSGGPKDAVAWVLLFPDMPLHGTKEFKEMTVTICLRKSLLKERTSDQISITIAHELSHIVLESIRHPLRKCEKAVDLTAMLLGFGRLYETASHTRERVGDYISGYDLGYLSEQEMQTANELLTPAHLRSKIKALRELPPTPSSQVSGASGRYLRGLQAIGRRFLGLLLLFGVLLAWSGATELYSRYDKWQLHQTLLAEQAEAQMRPLDNASMILLDARVQDYDLTYLYSVSRNNPAWEKDIRRYVCADEKRKIMIRDGASYTYEFRGPSRAIVGRFKIASCP